MAFHLLAYTASNAAAAAFADTPGITDGWATLQNGHYILPRDMRCFAAYAQGAALSAARINTPTLRQISMPNISPLELAAAPSDLPALMMMGDYGFQLNAIDETAVQLSNTAGAPEREFAFLWVEELTRRAPAPGPSLTLAFSATNTGGNLTWGDSALTFNETLPAGRYQVIGMDIIGANLIAARLRFPEGGMLPGVLARQALGTLPWWFFRHGRAGIFGEFDNTAPPILNILGSAAGTTQTGFLDVIKVR